MCFDKDCSGSGRCNHHFGNIRIRYNRANLQNCEYATAKATSSHSCIFFTRSKTNTSGARKENKSKLFQPMFKKGDKLNEIK